MYHVHPDLAHAYVNDHHDELRRAAGDSRLRRQVRHHHRPRRRG
jgi:hypothetical protein